MQIRNCVTSRLSSVKDDPQCGFLGFAAGMPHKSQFWNIFNIYEFGKSVKEAKVAQQQEQDIT